jgi:hypothetical protein
VTDSPDKHGASDDFVEYLARDTMRRLRYDTRFAGRYSSRSSRFGSMSALGIAGGVALTLITGMVLGASANYASAEVLPNGTTTIPSRPPLAILPIKNALSAIGCTQVAQAVPSKKEVVADTLLAAVTEPKPSAQQVKYPDRAMIRTLVTQRQPVLIRGDTASDYVLVVLDDSKRYVWSTQGSGGLQIEVGGDTRTRGERREYERVHVEEFLGQPTERGSLVTGSFSRDSNLVLGYAGAFGRIRGDSAPADWKLRYSSARLELLATRQRADSGRDSIVDYRFWSYKPGYYGLTTDLGPDSARGTYTVGWNPRLPRRAQQSQEIGGPGQAQQRPQGTFALTNRAWGLGTHGSGESGIVGLPSANVTAADLYVFAAGELAPQPLHVVVVQLKSGTVWSVPRP